jgi:two-component system, NtrC family, response regulator HydG
VNSISPAARKALMAYGWPGNVRELKNTIESMVVIDYDGVLDVDDLPEDIQTTTPAAVETESGLSHLVGRPLDEIEKYYIAATLKMTEGNREEAAKLLGIGERTLYRKIKEYGIG